MFVINKNEPTSDRLILNLLAVWISLIAIFISSFVVLNNVSMGVSLSSVPIILVRVAYSRSWQSEASSSS